LAESAYLEALFGPQRKTDLSQALLFAMAQAQAQHRPASSGIVLPASEAIAAGDLVNVYVNTGVMTVQKADGSDPAKFCNGFSLTGIGNGLTGPGPVLRLQQQGHGLHRSAGSVAVGHHARGLHRHRPNHSSAICCRRSGPRCSASASPSPKALTPSSEGGLMSLSPGVLYLGGALTNALVTLYTSPANSKSLVTKTVFTNTDTVARLLTVNLIRSGGSASAANILVDAQSIPAGASYEATELEGQWLNTGDFIQAKADTGAVVNCTGISGYAVA
jgi:hypothetical protein